MDARQQFSDSNPSFFWQGCLILTPIVVLTLLGFLSLRQDRLMVEQEARRRAGEIAADLETRLSRAIASELVMYQATGNLWVGDGVIGGRIRWPGRSPLTSETIADYERLLSEWKTKNPTLLPNPHMSHCGWILSGSRVFARVYAGAVIARRS